MPSVVDKVGLQAIILQLSGLAQPTSVFWANDPNPAVSDTDQATVALKLLGISALHVDEHRRWVSDGTDGYTNGAFITQEIGNREVTIQLIVEAFYATVEASEIIDRIRTGIRADTVVAQLNAIKLALEWAMPTVLLPMRAEQRVVSRATCDIRFGAINHLEVVIPPGGSVDGDYIQTINAPNNPHVPGTYS